MLILHRILGIYRIIIIVWAVMSWIPALHGSIFFKIVGLPVEPVLRLFSFASIGFVGFAPIILLGIIWGLEVMIEKKLKADGIDVYDTGDGEGDKEDIRRIE